MKLFRLLLAIFVFSWFLNAQNADARIVRLEEYLRAYHSPVAHLAPVFIDIADQKGLDWRLLPALAIVESSAGKSMRHNNLFGWASGNKKFTSAEQSIQIVGDALGTARWYKSKTFVAAMRTYNPASRAYPEKVRRAMLQIDNAPVGSMLVQPKQVADAKMPE
jgi:hypothetical protein